MTSALCRPEWVVTIHTQLRAQLWTQGKTQVWNRGQVEPANIDVLQFAARTVDPEAIVWRDSANLPTTEQGVVILGTPLGHVDCARAFALRSIPIGLCWRGFRGGFAGSVVVFVVCRSRANFLLRALSPHVTHEFSFCPSCWERSFQRPLSLGGLGLLRHVANWASLERFLRNGAEPAP